jgi:RimJ/RimL family protein N-acetyltransferase
VATTGTRGRIVAVARYFRIDGRSAEMAIVVEDAYQGQGLGRRLMHRLREMALRDGITEFVAEVLPSNVAMFRLLEEMGETHTTYDRGVCEVRVGLAAVASS